MQHEGPLSLSGAGFAPETRTEATQRGALGHEVTALVTHLEKGEDPAKLHPWRAINNPAHAGPAAT